MQLTVIETKLGAICADFLALARVSALRVLTAADLEEQARGARQAWDHVETAADVATFAARFGFRIRVRGDWPPGVHPRRLVGEAGVDRHELAATVRALARRIHDLRSAVRAVPLPPPLLEHLAALPLPRRPVGKALPAGRGGARRRGATRPAAGRGPRHVPLDPVFERTFSLLDHREPEFGQTTAESAPALWCLALHESTAASLCALSSFESDGMPLDFYRDMAKQCWDETRHARFFLSASQRLLDDAARSPRATPQLRAVHARLRKTGRGLPVAAEGNLYEVFWNASLVERLILMNLDTEAPGVAGLRRDSKMPVCARRPWLRDGFLTIMQDERMHARAGLRWLEFLVPSPAQRKEARENARLLRGFLILSALAHDQKHGGLLPLLDKVAATPPAGGSRPFGLRPRTAPLPAAAPGRLPTTATG